jgi:hypothetical protein
MRHPYPQQTNVLGRIDLLYAFGMRFPQYAIEPTNLFLDVFQACVQYTDKVPRNIAIPANLVLDSVGANIGHCFR